MGSIDNDGPNFRKPEYYIRYIEPLGSDLEQKVEYNMDDQDREWLESVNADRRKEQLGGVSYEVFEIVMDQLCSNTKLNESVPDRNVSRRVVTAREHAAPSAILQAAGTIRRNVWTRITWMAGSMRTVTTIGNERGRRSYFPGKVYGREMFAKFDVGWILPDNSRRGGCAPVDRQAIELRRKKPKAGREWSHLSTEGTIVAPKDIVQSGGRSGEIAASIDNGPVLVPASEETEAMRVDNILQLPQASSSHPEPPVLPTTSKEALASASPQSITQVTAWDGKRRRGFSVSFTRNLAVVGPLSHHVLCACPTHLDYKQARQLICHQS
ncbi:enhancer of polycomb-like-domain-containing protein [Irpex rosettiformis]|uniref:Enhancer of polycomb-like-domain-containing protein n=1 Tax=Irpex rosettiformis TaxID=378272 RepID=A0ACB8TT76_9APHY|nr:enhancer of polycomb-like-domain-containing protein [Irpex rosettiformis]